MYRKTLRVKHSLLICYHAKERIEFRNDNKDLLMWLTVIL